jgi:hypothetical protein
MSSIVSINRNLLESIKASKGSCFDYRPFTEEELREYSQKDLQKLLVKRDAQINVDGYFTKFLTLVHYGSTLFKKRIQKHFDSYQEFEGRSDSRRCIVHKTGLAILISFFGKSHEKNSRCEYCSHLEIKVSNGRDLAEIEFPIDDKVINKILPKGFYEDIKRPKFICTVSFLKDRDWYFNIFIPLVKQLEQEERDWNNKLNQEMKDDLINQLI